jgi:hypothetical protein
LEVFGEVGRSDLVVGFGREAGVGGGVGPVPVEEALETRERNSSFFKPSSLGAGAIVGR